MKSFQCSLLYAVFFFSLLMFSCKKEHNNNDTGTGESYHIPAPSPVVGTVSGRILDENNTPVESAVVDCAGLSTSTDANGFFNIPNATLDKYVSTITVTKAGYFKGYRSFSASTARNYINIKLIPKILTGTVDGNSAGSISLTNGSEIRFQANSFVFKSSGAAYSGTVNVYASYIDPTSADIASTVPGSFLGRDADNYYALASAGMIAAEIESAAGEPLQLAANMPAILKLLIPTSLLNKVPQTIDSWSLNENGIWVKEGVAVKTGNYYEAEASHFSFWNIGYSINCIYLTMHVQDQNGNSLTNTVTRLTQNAAASQWWGTTYGTTDQLGNVSGFVPANLLLFFEIMPYSGCVSAYSQNVGPFAADISLTISAAINLSQVIAVSGTLNDCSGMPFPSGTALIYDGSNSYYVYTPVSNGTYSATIIHCNTVSSLNVVLYDADATTQTLVGPVAVSGNSVVIPTATICPPVLNIYDGIYTVTGTFYDVTNPTAIVNYPKQYYIITTGPNTVKVAEMINGEIVPGFTFGGGSGTAYYGNFGLQLTMDLSTNLILEMHNYYGDPANIATTIGTPQAGTGAPDYSASNTRRAVLNPAGLNSFDPLARVFEVKYYMLQQSVVPTGFRCSMEETWTYTGPR